MTCAACLSSAAGCAEHAHGELVPLLVPLASLPRDGRFVIRHGTTGRYLVQAAPPDYAAREPGDALVLTRDEVLAYAAQNGGFSVQAVP